MEYTKKFADKVDERYFPYSITAYGTNQNYNWDGAKTIEVTSIGTVAMSDYDRTKGYGAVEGASDLVNTLQTLTLTKDRSFRFKLDKMDEDETKIKAGEALARQIREVVVPEVEAYRFLQIGKAIKANTASGTEITGVAGKAYENFLSANEKLDDLFVPTENRVAYCSPTFINSLKTDTSFIKASELGQKILIKGQIGEVDGVAIVKTPKLWLANATLKTQAYGCIIVDKMATVAPIKLQNYEVIDHPDFDGLVGQGRVYYDAFVLDMKKLGLVGVTKP